MNCTSFEKLEELIVSESTIFNIAHLARAVQKVKDLYSKIHDARVLLKTKIAPLIQRIPTDQTHSSIPFEKIITSLAHLTDATDPLVPFVISKLNQVTTDSIDHPFAVLWALAKLKQKDPDLIKKTLSDVYCLLNKVTGEDLGRLCWSLQKLELVNNNKMLIKKIEERARSLSKKLIPQSRCLVISLLSKIKSSVVELLLDDCKHHLNEFENRHLDILMSALLTLGITRDKYQLCHKILTIGMNRFDTMSFRHIACFADFASTSVRRDIASNFLIKTQNLFLKNPENFNCHDLFKLTCAFSNFYTLNKEITLPMSKLIAEKAVDFSVEQLYSQYKKLSYLGNVDEALFEVLINGIYASKNNLSTDILCASIFLLSKTLTNAKYLPKITSIIEFLFKQDLELRHKEQIIPTVHILVYVYNASFSDEIINQCELYSKEVQKESKPISSVLHQTISDTLTRLKLGYENEVYINGYWVDILLPEKVILEVNGPSHYKNHKLEVNALIKRRVLRKLGYRLYYLSNKSIDECSPKQMDELIKKIMKTNKEIQSHSKKRPINSI